jgi:hypothetical protein
VERRRRSVGLLQIYCQCAARPIALAIFARTCIAENKGWILESRGGDPSGEVGKLVSSMLFLWPRPHRLSAIAQQRAENGVNGVKQCATEFNIYNN